MGNSSTKFIFVTGGVISGLGKGVISASIGRILKMFGEEKITIKSFIQKNSFGQDDIENYFSEK